MYTTAFITVLLSATAALGLVLPETNLETRRVVNPNAITNTVCTCPSTILNDHEINVAILSICGGIAGKIEQCRGAPEATTGASGEAKFSLKAATAGTTIDITKGRWEGCVAAARAVCGNSPFTSTCIGGAAVNADNVDFALSQQ